MITKEQLINMDKKGIEALFNSCISDVTVTSIEPSEVKEAMLIALNKNLSGFNCRAIDYHNNNISLQLGYLTIKIKVSVKTTGKVVKVTKLRSKEVKGKGGFKISDILYELRGFVFEYDDKKKCTIKLDEKWSTSGLSDIRLEKCEGTLKEICTTENLIRLSNLQEQSYVDDHNKYLYGDRVRKPDYKGIEYEYMLSMAQPVLKEHYSLWHLKVNKTWLTFIPKEHQHLLPNKVNHENVFEVIVRTIGKINADLLNDVIYNKLFPENRLLTQN